MALIRDAAVAAATLAAQQEEAARQAARDALVAGARLAVEALAAPDGKLPLAGKGKDMAVEQLDVATGLVFLTDWDVVLAVRQRAEVWEIRVASKGADGKWTVRSSPVTTLAELADALAVAGT